MTSSFEYQKDEPGSFGTEAPTPPVLDLRAKFRRAEERRAVAGAALTAATAEYRASVEAVIELQRQAMLMVLGAPLITNADVTK